MTRSVVLLVVFALGASACTVDAADSAPDCGPDIIELVAEGDHEAFALYERSEEEFQARWLERVRCLAEDGDAEAQLKLGIAYRDGNDGPAQNHAEAAVWFRRAAEQGHPMAQLNLARLYQTGRGVPQDLVAAHMWYHLASGGFELGDESRIMATARRDQVASQLNPADLRKARQLASEWSAKRP